MSAVVRALSQGVQIEAESRGGDPMDRLLSEIALSGEREREARIVQGDRLDEAMHSEAAIDALDAEAMRARVNGAYRALWGGAAGALAGLSLLGVVAFLRRASQ